MCSFKDIQMNESPDILYATINHTRTHAQFITGKTDRLGNEKIKLMI